MIMASDPSREQIAAREEVMKCEKEIQSIKAALRRLGSVGNADEPNTLDVVLIKVCARVFLQLICNLLLSFFAIYDSLNTFLSVVSLDLASHEQIEGLPVDAQPTLHLQLSSPIEEGTISIVYDPLNCDPAPEGSLVSFSGVETSTATLTVSAEDANIPLGSSRPQDIAPLCAIDPLEAKDEYVTEFSVGIIGDNVLSGSTEGGEFESTDVDDEPAVPVCTVTLKITYKASPKDLREALYEVLNKTSQRKASALDDLRKISMMAVSRESSSSSSSKAAGTVAKPAVKPGFLNKKKTNEPTRLQTLYEKTIGPNSILVKGVAMALVSRNYLIFFGAVAAFHYKGQLLSLPPPV